MTAAELLERGVAASNVGRTVEATALLRQAIDALPSGVQDPRALSVRIRALCALSYTEAETGTAETGQVRLANATELVDQLPDGPLRLTLRGQVHHQQGLMKLRLGHYAAAVEAYDAGIPLLERSVTDPAGDPELLAKSYLNRGLAHIEQGKPRPAEQDMHRCIALAEGHPLPRLVAKATGNLGEIALLTGDIPGALRYLAAAEREFRRDAPGIAARARIDQARALLAAGAVDEAAWHLDEVLPVLAELRISQDLAEAEIARAAAAVLTGELSLARTLASSAHRRFVKRGSLPWAEVAALTRLQADTVAALDGQPSSASATRAAGLARRLASVGLTDEAAKATLLGVRLALRRGAVATARSMLDEVPPARRIAPIDHKMLLRLCRAELAVAGGDTRRALAEARAAFAELDTVRDRMGGLDLVCGTAVHGQTLGRLAVRLLLDRAHTQADARRLLGWQERTRAQLYRYEPLPPIEDPVLSEMVTELRAVLSTVRQNKVDGRRTGDLERRSAELQREVARLGWHTSRWGMPRPVCTPTEVAAALGERVLVSFAAPGDELAAVVMSGGSTRVVRLAPREDVLEVARQLRADLDALAPDELIAPLVAAVSASARLRIERLEALLMRPLAPLLGDRDVVVVPFAALFQVPWGLLPTLRGRSVAVVPSATAWVRAATAPIDTTAGAVLVTGPNVPGAVDLGSIYPDAVALRGDAATTDAVLSALDGAGLAHVAAHGTHEPGNALFSRLELANGALLAHEVAGLRRAPRHVVLAACELALTNIRSGDEVLGFAGSMLASGSHTVVAAVTRVGDQATAQAMAEYHGRLAAGEVPAAALAATIATDPLHRPFICLGTGH